jgi:hypothetical protein
MGKRKSLYNLTTRERDVRTLITHIMELEAMWEGNDKITIGKGTLMTLADLAKSIDEKSANGIWITKTN